MLQDTKFVPYDASFLPLSWDWLSDPEIKALTMTPDFNRTAQLRWFEGLRDRKDYLIWGVQYAAKPIGACGLKGISDGSGEYWGYIGDKSYWGVGIGSVMINFIESHARDRNLNRLWLQVWKRNRRATRLYEKLGFRLDRQTDDVAILSKTLS